MSKKDDDGATKEPPKPKDCPDANGIMHSHSYQWVWENGQMTDKVKCINCGHEKVNLRNAPHQSNG